MKVHDALEKGGGNPSRIRTLVFPANLLHFGDIRITGEDKSVIDCGFTWISCYVLHGISADLRGTGCGPRGAELHWAGQRRQDQWISGFVQSQTSWSGSIQEGWILEGQIRGGGS